MLRERLCERAQDASRFVENGPIVGRPSTHDEACACQAQRVTTTTTADSSKTLTNDTSASAPFPIFGKAECTCHRKRALSTIAGPIASDAFQNRLLAPRSQSFAAVMTRCSECGESLKVQSSVINTGKLPPTPSWIKSWLTTLDTETETHEPEYSPLSSPTTTDEPLILPTLREQHNASPQLRAKFQELSKTWKIDFSVELWLRLATWWLIKSRTIFRLLLQKSTLQKSPAVPQHQHGWENATSAEQAYTDLLKASWILEDIVLVDRTNPAFQYTNIRRIIQNLARSLDRELSRCRDPDLNSPHFEDQIVLKQDLHLVESFEQTIEAKDNIPNAMDDPEPPHRWMEVDQDNAGIERERVKFRTFVNAQLGSRTDRSKSSSAPYMLLLWTSANDDALFVSLCNQRGSVNLSREIGAEDIERYAQSDALLPLQLDFPSQEAEVMFVTLDDMSRFFDLPGKFLTAMQQRDPCPEELPIYRTTVSSYSDSSPRLHPGAKQVSTLAASKYASCGLRIYETIPDKSWKSTRRLVVNTPPDNDEPQCVSHWLPTSNVRVTVEDSKATVSWSDCGQLEQTREGNYDIHYAFIYNAEDPNRKITLDFRNESDAQRFKECLLLPTELPTRVSTKVVISSAFQTTRIYRLFDEDEPDRQYHAIASTRRSPKGPHATELFYVYRDLDWRFVTKNRVLSMIDFPYLRIANYVSTVPRLQFEPGPKDVVPEYSECKEGTKPAHLDLGCDHDMTRFMHGLTGWTLKFFRNTAKMVLIDTSPFFRNSRETHRQVDVQLWEKPAEEGKSRTQFAVRLDTDNKHRWITASLLDNGTLSESYTVEVRGLSIQRGVEIDIKDMSATNRVTQQRGRNRDGERWKIQLVFEERERKCESIAIRSGHVANGLLRVADKDEFLRASGLT